jgi:hypothetical protein
LTSTIEDRLGEWLGAELPTPYSSWPLGIGIQWLKALLPIEGQRQERQQLAIQGVWLELKNETLP